MANYCVKADSCKPPERHAKNRKCKGAPEQIVPMERGPFHPVASNGFRDGELNEVCGEIDRLDGAGGAGGGYRHGELKDVIVGNAESKLMGVEDGVLAVPCGELQIHIGHSRGDRDDDVGEQEGEDRQRSSKRNALGIHGSQTNGRWRSG